MTPEPCPHCGHIDWAHDDHLTPDLRVLGWCHECDKPCPPQPTAEP